MVKICRYFGRSKQGYYQHKQVLKKKQLLIDQIIPAVKQVRANQPFIGVRKLQYMLESKDITVGRDALFDILREYNMLSKVYRRKCFTSTGSKSKYPNLAKAMGPAQRVGEILVSDITYLRTKKGFAYLSLTSDSFSNSILGYSLQNDLGTQGPLLAFEQARKKLGIMKSSKDANWLRPIGIHHSDHGSQYTSNKFQKALYNCCYLPSMTGVGKCYDNAKAERINGVLKHELALKKTFEDFDEAVKYLKDAIKIYNNERIIISNGYKTPAEMLKVA